MKNLSDKILEFEMEYNRQSKDAYLSKLDEIRNIINCLDIFESVNGKLSEALDNVYEILQKEYQIYNPKD
jgi:hypothetical protein